MCVCGGGGGLDVVFVCFCFVGLFVVLFYAFCLFVDFVCFCLFGFFNQKDVSFIIKR